MFYNEYYDDEDDDYPEYEFREVCHIWFFNDSTHPDTNQCMEAISECSTVIADATQFLCERIQDEEEALRMASTIAHSVTEKICFRINAMQKKTLEKN